MATSAAFAADLPARRAPPAVALPVPAFVWTGLYVGAQAGYDFGRSNAFAFNTVTGAGLTTSNSNRNGIIAGGHVGYLFASQPVPVLGPLFGNPSAVGVVGVEGDVDGTSARAVYPLGGFNDDARIGVQGSIRGRAGVAVDRVLLYGTGGVAFGTLRNSYTNVLTGGFDQDRYTRIGYTVGGGVEYAFTNNILGRIEGRHTDYGTLTNVLTASSGGGLSVRQRETENRIQAGISYKFTPLAPAPVVARY